VAGVALAVAAIALAVALCADHPSCGAGCCGRRRIDSDASGRYLWLPPLFAVNHVLTRGCAATAVRTLGIKDSLVADIQLPN
jgi:hypothetical protein